jgi:hypothetical protein
MYSYLNCLSYYKVTSHYDVYPGKCIMKTKKKFNKATQYDFRQAQFTPK